MEERKKKGLGFVFVNILIFLITVLLIGAVTWFFRKSATETIRNVVVNITGCAILIYVIEVWKDELSNPGRIAVCYFAGLLSCIGGAFLPPFIMPLLSFGLLLMLFTDFAVGICAYALFCMNITLLSASAADVFFYYFITGLFAMALYVRILKGTFCIVKPVIMISAVSIVLYTALSVLRFFKLTADMIINPMIGLLLNIFILSIALYVYNRNVLHPDSDKYAQINDPEYTLLMQLKSQDKDTYFLAIHTAYLCDRIADRLGLDRSLLKAGGYYERIGILLDKKYYEKNREIMKQHRFPSELISLIEECTPQKSNPKHKEAAIIMMSDAVITGISHLIRKKPDEKIDYGKIIDVVIEKMQRSGVFRECNMTLGEFCKVQQYLKEEALYYDFLR